MPAVECASPAARTTFPTSRTSPCCRARSLGWICGVPAPATAVYSTKTASAAATDNAMTSRAGLRLTPGRIPALGLVLAGDHAAAGDPVPVIVAKRTRRVLGERVAVALAVRGPHEGGDDLEVPLGDLARLAPEIGEAEIDVELEQVDPRGARGHGETVEKASDGLGSRRGRDPPRALGI